MGLENSFIYLTNSPRWLPPDPTEGMRRSAPPKPPLFLILRNVTRVKLKHSFLSCTKGKNGDRIVDPRIVDPRIVDPRMVDPKESWSKILIPWTLDPKGKLIPTYGLLIPDVTWSMTKYFFALPCHATALRNFSLSFLLHILKRYDIVFGQSLGK